MLIVLLYAILFPLELDEWPIFPRNAGFCIVLPVIRDSYLFLF